MLAIAMLVWASGTGFGRLILLDAVLELVKLPLSERQINFLYHANVLTHAEPSREFFSKTQHGTLFNNRFRSFNNNHAIGLFCSA